MFRGVFHCVSLCFAGFHAARPSAHFAYIGFTRRPSAHCATSLSTSFALHNGQGALKPQLTAVLPTSCGQTTIVCFFPSTAVRGRIGSLSLYLQLQPPLSAHSHAPTTKSQPPPILTSPRCCTQPTQQSSPSYRSCAACACSLERQQYTSFVV